MALLDMLRINLLGAMMTERIVTRDIGRSTWQGPESEAPKKGEVMINYNDGKWHGFNGGECPVHPKTVVDIVTAERGLIPYEGRRAGFTSWNGATEPIIAFRVIKEHKEPERAWSRCVDGATYRNVEFKFIGGVAHVREVLE